MVSVAKRSQDKPVPHLTPGESAARGKAARAEVPRSSHAHYEPAANRTDPIALLEEQAATRVPDLVPIRYGRMLVSPFTFYRGAAKIMAHDLASTPRSGLTVQCCGDAHLSNFGVFGSAERRLIFDINDFDETLPGPWEWDVKRLAASMLIAARDNGYRRRAQDAIVLACVEQYRKAVREFAKMRNLDVWYSRLEIEGLLAERASELKPAQVKKTSAALAKARTRDSLSTFSKLTTEVDGEVRIADQSPLIVPIDKLGEGADREQILSQLGALVRRFRASLPAERRVLLEQFELVDFARKVVGVGSVGTRAWIALLLGRVDNDPLFLQFKEAEASVFEDLLMPSEFSNHGQRVVVGQRLMQASSDIMLGWLHVVSPLDNQQRDFYGRQLKDWKGSVEIDQLLPEGMQIYGRLCAWTLARAHARSGDRIALASYLGGGDAFDRAILEFSHRYVEQNERDYEQLVKAVDSGRVPVQTGI